LKTDTLSNLNTLQLLEYYEAIMEELNTRKVLSTFNNPVSGYAEYLACKVLNLTQAKNSEKGFDAIDKNLVRYQIKSRRIGSGRTPNRLGVIRNIEEHNFDYLIAIIFESNFQVKFAIQMPFELVKRKAKFNDHTNGWILRARESSLRDVSSLELTSQFMRYQAEEQKQIANCINEL